MSVVDSGNGVLRSYDLDTMEAFLRVCRTDLVLLGGSPLAGLDAVVVDGSLVGRITLGMRIRGRFVLPRDWMLLLYLIDAEEQHSWCHGVPMGTGSCVTVLPTGAAEFGLAAGTQAVFALLPRQMAGGGDVPSSVLDDPSRLEPGVRFHAEAEAFHAETWQSLQSRTFDASRLGRWLELHRLSQPRDAHLSLASLRARRSRYLVFRKAEDFMLANMRRQLYMHEICDAAGTSERTLRYAFDDLTGSSPGRYLSLMRLCAACRALSRADASEESVKSVALSCGLWDLSRFADSYRTVFGELPRETLQRAVV